MYRILSFLTFSALLCCAIHFEAKADVIVELLDKTKITGQFEHYYDGVLSIKLPNGSSLRLPEQKVQLVNFKLPKARSEFSSPQKSFQQLKKAALDGDLERYIDCHSSYYQMFLHHQIELAGPAEFLKRLKKEWGDIKLEILNTSIKAETAILKVRRKQEKDEAQEGELRFVKENNEWKMILPL